MDVTRISPRKSESPYFNCIKGLNDTINMKHIYTRSNKFIFILRSTVTKNLIFLKILFYLYMYRPAYMPCFNVLFLPDL